MIENISTIIFDVDGTVAKKWEDEILPGRRQKLAQLKAQGKRIFLATNQGGPAYRMLYTREGSAMADNYPRLIDVISRLYLITQAIGAESCFVALHPGPGDIAETLCPTLTMDPVAVHMFYDKTINACWQLEWRKPRPGMIWEIVRETNARHGSILLVGDSMEDMDAAHASGILYSDADEFFHGEEAS
jgi:histidinol phosphatase-like enzyme